MKKYLCFLLPALFLISPATNALENYLGINYGKSVFTQFLYGGDDSSLSIYAGTRINRNLGLELFYTDLGEYDGDLFDTTCFAIDGYGASLQANFPMTDRFEIFAKIGVIAWDKDVISGSTTRTDDGTDLLYGFGIDFGLNQTLSLRAGYELYDLEDTLDMATIGIKVNL
jgi:hypothetical protein